MNRFKFNRYLQEFPFVSGVSTRALNALDCDSFAVKRITKELLDKTPKYDGATGSLVGIDDGEEIFFVVNGTLAGPVQTDGSVIHNEAHSDNENWDGETVLEAIDRLKIAPDTITHIVSFEYGYEVLDHYSQGNYRLTIYKAPVGFTIADYVKEAIEKADNEVKAECAF